MSTEICWTTVLELGRIWNHFSSMLIPSNILSSHEKPGVHTIKCNILKKSVFIDKKYLIAKGCETCYRHSRFGLYLSRILSYCQKYTTQGTSSHWPSWVACHPWWQMTFTLVSHVVILCIDRLWLSILFLQLYQLCHTKKSNVVLWDCCSQIQFKRHKHICSRYL